MRLREIRNRREPAQGRLRTLGVVLAIGLTPLTIGGTWMYHHANERELESERQALVLSAASEASDVEEYFDRARLAILLTATSPAFSGYYEDLAQDPADPQSVAAARIATEDSLLHLQRFYRNAIGEACFIDRRGAENARIVGRVRADPSELSPDESAARFFAPSFAMGLGEVYQAKPYRSPDTHEWVISNSTQVPFGRGKAPAIVHFEVTIESFRREAAALTDGQQIYVVDATDGSVIFSGDERQRRHEPLGDAADTRFADLAAHGGSSGTTELDGNLVAYQRISGGPHNANHWLVVLTAPASADGVLLAAALPLAAMILALLFFGSAVARRWHRMTIVESGRASDARLAATVRNSSDMVSVLAPDGRIRMQVGATRQMIGFEPEDLIGRPFLELCHSDDRAAAKRLISGRCVNRADSGELRIINSDGDLLNIELTVAELAKGEGRVVTARDVTARKNLEEQLRHRAFHDPLTKLANRALFHDRVDHALAAAEASGDLTAAIFADLDNFKPVNDGHGHAIGDQVLCIAARRLSSVFDETATVARLGGDEFGVLLERVEGVAEVQALAHQAAALFAEPIRVDDLVIPIRITMGLAVATPGRLVSEDLLEHADFAMYAEKERGKNGIGTYSPALERRRGDRDDDQPTRASHPSGRKHWFATTDEQYEEIISILESPDSLHYVFQPVVSLRSGRVEGYEALARFAGPINRPPNAWFEQAHRCGLGNRLEARALATAIAAGSTRPDGTFLSLNASPSALVSSEVAEVLPERLDNLVIEVTENELALGGGRLSEVVVDLRRRGARIAVDDAGAGYAGLAQITALKPDIIKLDRGLINQIEQDPAKVALVDAFVRFARKIGAELCAEGIETPGELRALSDLDAGLGQGYHLARPADGFAAVSLDAIDGIEEATAEAMKLVPLGSSVVESDRAVEFAASHLSHAITPSDLVPALEVLASALSAESISLSYLDRAAWSLIEAAHSGVGCDHGPLEIAQYPVTAHVLGSSEAARIFTADDSCDRAEVELLRRLGLASALLVPVFFGGAPVGLLRIARIDETRGWTRLELMRARLISHSAGATLVRMFETATAAGPRSRESSASDIG